MIAGSTRKVLVVPCSGIGKTQGLIAREAACQVTDRLMPGEAKAVCLALLVTGDAEALGDVARYPSITIDGCPKLCARKNVELAGGRVVLGVRVHETLKQHRGVQPGTPTALSPAGWDIADEIAVEVAETAASLVDSLELDGNRPAVYREEP